MPWQRLLLTVGHVNFGASQKRRQFFNIYIFYFKNVVRCWKMSIKRKLIIIIQKLMTKNRERKFTYQFNMVYRFSMTFNLILLFCLHCGRWCNKKRAVTILRKGCFYKLTPHLFVLVRSIYIFQLQITNKNFRSVLSVRLFIAVSILWELHFYAVCPTKIMV